MAYAIACPATFDAMPWHMSWHAMAYAVAYHGICHGMPWHMSWHAMAYAMTSCLASRSVMQNEWYVPNHCPLNHACVIGTKIGLLSLKPTCYLFVDWFWLIDWLNCQHDISFDASLFTFVYTSITLYHFWDVFILLDVDWLWRICHWFLFVVIFDMTCLLNFFVYTLFTNRPRWPIVCFYIYIDVDWFIMAFDWYSLIL